MSPTKLALKDGMSQLGHGNARPRAPRGLSALWPDQPVRRAYRRRRRGRSRRRKPKPCRRILLPSAARWRRGNHAALFLDGAGYNIAAAFAIPKNITRVCLSPYAPGLRSDVGSINAFRHTNWRSTVCLGQITTSLNQCLRRMERFRTRSKPHHLNHHPNRCNSQSPGTLLREVSGAAQYATKICGRNCPVSERADASWRRPWSRRSIVVVAHPLPLKPT